MNKALRRDNVYVQLLNDHTIPGLSNSFLGRNGNQTGRHLRNYSALDHTLPKP